MNTPAIELDFKRRRGPSRLGATLLAIGIGAGILAAIEYCAAGDELSHQLQTLDHAQRPTRSKHAVPLQNTDPQHMNLVLDRLTLPWERFFDALEAATSDQATLLAIVPDAAKGTVQIRGEARDIGVVLYYVSKLESGGVFRDVELVEHELSTQNSELPLRFLVSARWTSAPEKR